MPWRRPIREKDMELRQLQYFIAVAEELHFGHAAAREHVTQAALSQQVQRLERELRVPLFDRTTRRVQLTESGRVFLEDARAMLARARRAADTARQAAKGEAGQLVVGYPVTGRGRDASALLRAFRHRYPDIALASIPRCTVDLLEELRKEHIDLAFIHHPVTNDSRLNSRIISRRPYLLAIPSDHPLTARSHVALEQLTGEPLLMFPRALSPHHFDLLVQELANGSGSLPAVVDEASAVDDLIDGVASGIGLALIPRSHICAMTGDAVVFRQFEAPVPTLPLEIAWRRNDPSEAVAAFLTLVEDVMPVSGGHLRDRSYGDGPTNGEDALANRRLKRVVG
jgi:DNA-binding transcriptional LysR family regulator